MEKLSISYLQRNLHRLERVEIAEIVDKKRGILKGFYLDRRFAPFVERLASSLHNGTREESLFGALAEYAPKKADMEEGAWKTAATRKHLS